MKIIATVCLLITVTVTPVSGKPAWMDAKEVFQNMRPDARIIELFDRDLAFLGTRIHLIKFLDGHLQPGEVVLDSTGHVVDGDLLEDADSMVRHDIMGAMTEELWSKVVTAGTEEPIPVWVWARTYLDGSEGSKEPLNPITEAEIQKAWDIEVSLAHMEMLIAISSVGGQAVDLIGDAPVVRAILYPDEVRALSKHPEVAYIFPDPGPGIPTSTAYIGTLSSDVVHSWGFTGSGRVIAVQIFPRPDDASHIETVVMNPNSPVTDPMATGAVGFIRTKDGAIRWGTAPGATTVMANMDRTGYSGSYSNAEQWAIISQGARIFGFGWAMGNGNQDTLNGHDYYVDWLVKRYRLLYISSAGNRNGPHGEPCSEDTVHRATYRWNGSGWEVVPGQTGQLSEGSLMPSVGVATCCPGVGGFAWATWGPVNWNMTLRVLGL